MKFFQVLQPICTRFERTRNFLKSQSFGEIFHYKKFQGIVPPLEFSQNVSKIFSVKCPNQNFPKFHSQGPFSRSWWRMCRIMYNGYSSVGIFAVDREKNFLVLRVGDQIQKKPRKWSLVPPISGVKVKAGWKLLNKDRRCCNWLSLPLQTRKISATWHL